MAERFDLLEALANSGRLHRHCALDAAREIAAQRLLIAGAVCIYHGVYPARPFDRITLPVFGVLFFGLAGLMAFPPLVPVLTPLFWFLAKVGFLLFVFIWIRATLPRFRYDQLMSFAWKFLFPAALVNLLITGFLVAWFS